MKPRTEQAWAPRGVHVCASPPDLASARHPRPARPPPLSAPRPPPALSCASFPASFPAQRFKYYQAFDEAEFSHWLLPREGVVYAYVVEAPGGEVTDMVSFYNLPSTIIGNEKYPVTRRGGATRGAARLPRGWLAGGRAGTRGGLAAGDLTGAAGSARRAPLTPARARLPRSPAAPRPAHRPLQTLLAAYSYYTVANKTPLDALLKDAMIEAVRNDFDVFNALDLQDNLSVLKDLKFGIGDGKLQYYAYNWKCPPIAAHEVGLILL